MTILKAGLKKLDVTPWQMNQLLAIPDLLSEDQKKAIYEVFTIPVTNFIRDHETDLLKEESHAWCLSQTECVHVTLSVLSFLLDSPPDDNDPRIHADPRGESGNPKLKL